MSKYRQIGTYCLRVGDQKMTAWQESYTNDGEKYETRNLNYSNFPITNKSYGEILARASYDFEYGPK